MTIDLSQAAFVAAAMLRKFEGLRLAPYLCPAGKLTVGYGHVILPAEVNLRGGITEDEAERLLLRDLAWALFAVRSVGRVLNDGQAAALASLIYNIGQSAWWESTIRGCVIDGQMPAAAREFVRWAKVGGVVNAGLLARRCAEKKVFEGAVWTG